jgi:hypothetical protein
MLSNAYSKYYAPLEHPTVDTVIVLWRGRLNFKQYTSKKQKHFPMKICKLFNTSGYTYDMGMYSGNNRTHLTSGDRTHITVQNLTGKVEGHEHQLGGTQVKYNGWVIDYSVSNTHPPPCPPFPDRLWILGTHIDHFLHPSVSPYMIILSFCMALNDTCRTDQATSVWLFNILTYRIIHKIPWCMYRGSQLSLLTLS